MTVVNHQGQLNYCGLLIVDRGHFTLHHEK